MKRNRYLFFILTVLVMMLGLLSRKINALPNFIFNYLGDTLWTLMVFFIITFIFPKKSTRFIGICSLLFSYTIEISQLYHALWIDTIRATTLGGLVLGFGFLWSDIICYTIGIFLGIVIDKILFFLSIKSP